jgi:hypothetical protein
MTPLNVLGQTEGAVISLDSDFQAFSGLEKEQL